MKLKEPLLSENIRANSYRILADCYYPPDENLIKKLGNLDASRGRVYQELLRNAPKLNELESLKVDFAGLFVGPFKLLAPPYGSLYLEGAGMVMGASTLDARKRYAEEGLKISLREVPDHIAIELEFMYYLIFKEVESATSPVRHRLGDTRVSNGANADFEKKASYLEKEISFLKTHLGAWINEFGGAVAANARSAFYKNLALLTKSFVENDLKNLSKLL